MEGVALDLCLRSAILRQIAFPENILLIDYLSVNQSLINLLYAKYSRLRDFHGYLDTLSATTQVSIFIAQTINSTLVSVNEVKQNCPQEFFKLTPTIHYHVNPYSLQEAFTRIKKIHGHIVKPSTIQRYTSPFALSYCDYTRRDSESWNPSSVFWGTADSLVWMWLLTSFILVNIVLQLRARKATLTISLTMLSVLLNSGVSCNKRYIRQSWLLALWACGCLIFATNYSCHLTSQVAKPADEFKYASIQDLYTNNYTMIANSYAISVIKSFASKDNSVPISKVLRRLLHTAKIVSIDDSPNFLATSANYACASTCPTSFKIVNQANEFIKVNNIATKHCYIVKETVLGENVYMVVSPPNRVRMKKALSIVMEMGIFDLWFREFVGMSLSSRVQGRKRMISLTKLRDEQTIPQTLGFTEGKLKNVFALWSTCLFSSIIIFLVERSKLGYNIDFWPAF